MQKRASSKRWAQSRQIPRICSIIYYNMYAYAISKGKSWPFTRGYMLGAFVLSILLTYLRFWNSLSLCSALRCNVQLYISICIIQGRVTAWQRQRTIGVDFVIYHVRVCKRERERANKDKVRFFLSLAERIMYSNASTLSRCLCSLEEEEEDACIHCLY